ncbi:MAG: nitronate monooxygenase [Pseudomonadota bacterium]
MTTNNFANLSARGTEFLGCKYPILGGAMSWVSEANLVSAISNAGGFGVIAGGAMPPEVLAQEISKTQQLTSNNFGVNLISMHPKLPELAAVCIESGIKYIVIAGGIPKASTINLLKDNGITVLCFAPTLRLAKKLVTLGVDAIIIEGMEAGGHIGPVATSVLIQEVVPHMECPVFVAGGIGTGDIIACYMQYGAAGCQLGTRFACSKESIAHPNFKQAFIKASARDAVPTVQLDAEFPVIPVRALTNTGTKEFLDVQRKAIGEFRAGKLSKQEAQLKIEYYWAGALRRAVIDGDVEHGSLMAGQSVGMVTSEQTVQEIIDELVMQAEQFCDGNNYAAAL